MTTPPDPSNENRSAPNEELRSAYEKAKQQFRPEDWRDFRFEEQTVSLEEVIAELELIEREKGRSEK